MNASIEHVLVQLHDLLSPIKAPWYVIGTSSLMLSGYNVKPNDIDILTDKETALAMAAILDDFRSPVQLTASEKFRSVFSRYIINGVSVEVMGDLQVNTVNGWINVLPLITDALQIDMGGRSFTVPSKTEQAQIYTLFDRKKDEAVLALLSHK